MNVSSFAKMKNKEKITAITAYDALFARIFDGEVDMILVGDSLNMSFGGHSDTLSLDLDSMIYHAKAVRSAVKTSLLIVDMPFGSYNSIDLALKNATRIYKETGADALKLEVGESKIDLIKELINNGIAIMPHIGLMPQFYRFEGGYKIKGKNSEQKAQMLDLSLKLQDCGAFSLLIEGTKGDIASEITKKLSIPVIGIGCGNGTDGQILVWSDVFGFFDETPKFVRKYLEGKSLIKSALKAYCADVKSGNFPNENESY